ncbi:MAG: Kae1-associated kinase Bud32 [Patescibacteria group bacterium]|jgi:Kae1-associated kinase Bud32
MTKELIQEGAEAKIFKIDNTVQKERVKKTYRHLDLDNKIRKQRTKREAKIYTKAINAGINTAKILNLNHKQESTIPFTLELEYLKAEKLSDTLSKYPEKEQANIMEKIGKQVAIMHQANIIHSDLTTANILYKDNKPYIIDFGLSYISPKVEDKAVDLHLIHHAVEAKHHKTKDLLIKSFHKGYKYSESDKIEERLKIVEKRGRYKDQH